MLPTGNGYPGIQQEEQHLGTPSRDVPNSEFEIRELESPKWPVKFMYLLGFVCLFVHLYISYSRYLLFSLFTIITCK